MTHHGPPFHTFVGRRNLTTTDKIISNKKFTFNLHLQQGPQATSDHLPIIAKISVNLIQIPIKPRYSFKKANWEEFKKELSPHQQGPLQNKTAIEIDTEIDKLYSAIGTVKRKHVPIIRYKVLPHIQFTPAIRNIITILNTTRTNLQQNFTIDKKRRYNLNLFRLKSEYQRKDNKL